MVHDSQKTSIIKVIASLFPFHLLFAQLKYNLLALFYWVFLFLIVSDNLGAAFGIPILFFSPEYLGDISFWSFLFIGFAMGGFTMGFNTYSYIRLAPHFPFLNTLNQPFLKFCLNNSILPIVFNLYFIFKFCLFQLKEELANPMDIAIYVSSYIGGYLLFLLFSAVYFFPMNKRVGRKLGNNFIPRKDEKVMKTVIPNKDSKVKTVSKPSGKTYIYFGKRLKFYTSRSPKHYSKELMSIIYQQNKVNATLFETIALVSFLSLGFLQGWRYFELPAAVSIILLLTIILMLFSALLSYLDRWAYPVIIGIFLLMNVLSVKTRFFTFKNYAYGLSYAKENRTDYSLKQIASIANDTIASDASKNNMNAILEEWKKKTGEKKPKLIFINVSGGGSRSALWVMNCMQKLDMVTHQNFSSQVQMVTGASGGMVGASYYRQLRYEFNQKKIKDLYAKEYLANMGADLLNKLSFSASTNDIFFRYKTFEKNNISYPMDRGTAFETQLNQNTDSLLDVPLSYYTALEKSAEVPVHIFTPTIVNDGRRMLMSSQKLTFLMNNRGEKPLLPNSFENVDYLSYFSSVSPEKVSFTSVLRASATFPFVMPMVTLPTNPGIQLMDAGIRDNYGGKITMEYLYAFNDWIKKNTSGVIIVQIRDTKKVLSHQKLKPVSLLKKFTLPFANMYSNFPRTQDFNQDEMFKLMRNDLTFPMDVISFNLREDSRDRISLSWHLTKQEKLKIENAFYSKSNQEALKELLKLLANK